MGKFFDANGNEVEAYSAEELEAKKKEALDSFVAENPDKGADLKKLQDELTAAQAKLKELEDGGGNDQQKSRLKSAKEDAEKALKDMETRMMGEIATLKSSLIDTPKKNLIHSMAKGNADLIKKIELEYDGFAGEVKTPEQVADRVLKAFTLATGTRPAPSFMDGIGGAGARGDNNPGAGPAVETDNSKAMRKQFGIDDKTAEKYAGEINKTNQ